MSKPWYKRASRKDSIPTLIVGEDNRQTKTGFKAGEGRSPEDLEDLYERYVRARLVALVPNSAFYADFGSQSVPEYAVSAAAKEEMRWGVIQAEKFGWATIVADGTNITAVGPLCNGWGVKVKEFDTMGIPKMLTYYYDPKDSTKNIDIPKDNFFILRTGDRLGWMGISKLIPVYDVILLQQQIMEDFAITIRNAAISFLHVNKKDASETSELTDLNTAIGNIQSRQKLVTGGDVTLTPISLMEKTFDPINIVNKIDEFVCNAFLIPRSFPSGDPSAWGQSTRQQNAGFYARVKELQDFYFPQLQPVLKRIGAPDDLHFVDPTEMTMQEKSQFLAVVQTILDKLNVDDQQVVDFINDNLGTDFTIDFDKQLAKEVQLSSMLSPGNGTPVTPKNEEVTNEKQNPAKPPAKATKKAKPTK